MWVLVLLNGVGLFSGLMNNSTIMYVIFAISFLTFFHKYAVVSWDVIYEERVESIGIIDAKIANEFVCFFVMASIFWMMIQKLGMWSIVVAIVQCIIFHIFKLIHDKTSNNIIIMIFYIVELVFSVIFCLS